MPQYDLAIHHSAERELDNLPTEKRSQLIDELRTVATYEQPSGYARAKHLSGQDKLFRVRSGDVRAICKLDKPHIRIIKVGERDGVYDDVDEIDDRLTA